MILDRWGSRDDQLRLTKPVMTRTTGGFNICLNASREESIHNLKIQLEECGWSDAEKDIHFGDGTLERAVWIGGRSNTQAPARMWEEPREPAKIRNLILLL